MFERSEKIRVRGLGAIDEQAPSPGTSLARGPDLSPVGRGEEGPVPELLRGAYWRALFVKTN